MQGDSSGSSENATMAAAGTHDGCELAVLNVGTTLSEKDKGRHQNGDRNCTGNRWPREETLALIKIRSGMDAAFRSSCPKVQLWEEVSRKLGELGYHRSAKKCKEKFENVYKYHRRTKEGRTRNHDKKTYKFFEQLQALENNHLSALPPPPPQPTTPPKPQHVPSISNPASMSNLQTKNPTVLLVQPINSSCANMSSSSPSSSTASDEELERHGSKKRKWKEFFRRMTKDVIAKQEELVKNFLETVEKCEHERMVREEAWRMHETARMNRQYEILVQEQSAIAAKHAAIMAFLQKISEGQQNFVQSNGNHSHSQPPHAVTVTNGDIVVSASSSRWPKAEVEALINIRTSLELKYQENGSKGSTWEEISASMQRLGYNRSAKRCKEKWENINKYFKKVKDSNRKRTEDSKTCPYFHQLDAIYKEKSKNIDNISLTLNNNSAENTMVPLMVMPEQQWPPQQEENKADSPMEDTESDENLEDDEGNTEEEDQNGYEVGASKGVSVGNRE